MPKPPKLLMITTVAVTLRGFLLPIAEHFQQQGWQVDAIACDVEADEVCCQRFDHVWNIPWSRNPLDPRNLIGVPKLLRKLIQQQEYEIIHVHTPVAAFVTRFGLRNVPQSKKPALIYTAHGFHFHAGGHPIRNALFLTLEKLAGRWTDELVVINQEDYNAALTNKLLPEPHVHHMQGIGVDLSYYCAERISPEIIQDLRHSLHLQEQDCLLLTIAELIPRKHVADLLHALAQTHRPTIHLAIAGTGPLLPELQEIAKQLNLTQQIHFLGFRTDIPAWICAAQAVLLVSEQEGLPRSIMEALALGVPVIGTDIRGTRDLLARGGGMLVSVGDITAIAQAMNWIADHPGDARQMGTVGREQIQPYRLESILQHHQQLYQTSLSRREMLQKRP
jgi:glycosyltransferase involved in cell wall biosynthesis